MSSMRKLTLVFVLGLGTLGLGGCGESDGPAENAGEAVDDAAERAGEAIENTGERIQRQAE